MGLILGFKVRWATLTLTLVVFTLAATLIFHNCWAIPEAQKMRQQLLFNKNIAVIGGLLTVAAWGAGAFSMDGKRSR